MSQPTMYYTIHELAKLAEAHRESAGDSKADLADVAGTKRPNVVRALNRPSTRDLQTLRRILDHYGVTVAEEPHFAIGKTAEHA